MKLLLQKSHLIYPLVGLLGTMVSGVSKANIPDPFYPPESEDIAASSEQNITPNIAKICQPTHAELVNLSLDFAQLKLVGLVQIEQQFHALFVDAQHSLVSLKPQDFVPSSQIQIQQISLKQLDYIDWAKTDECDKPHWVSVKL